jgi:hypothetical protein
MTSRTIPPHMRCSTPAHWELRADVAAILAGVPNAKDHVQGLGWVMEDVLHARMVREGAHESSATRKHPSYFAIPSDVRSRLSMELNKALADSGLSARDAWGDAYYGPLNDIEARHDAG